MGETIDIGRSGDPAHWHATRPRTRRVMVAFANRSAAAGDTTLAATLATMASSGTQGGARPPIAAREQKILWGEAATRCCFPGCRKKCVVDRTPLDGDVVVGENAHIRGYAAGGPRHDPNYPRDLLHKYANLILLCVEHHTIVDGQPNTYSVSVLQTWKQAHEGWVQSMLETNMERFRFAELEIACQALANAEPVASSALTAVPPAEKLQRNQLSASISIRLAQGLVRSPTVADFLQKMASLDAEFPQRLRAGFVAVYEEKQRLGSDGDALFYDLHEYASGGPHAVWEQQSAGLALLAHLFQLCEVFS
jgi:hypothetical protein